MSKANHFGLGRVTELDRKLAATEIEHARSTGEYDSAEAARRLARVRAASTHTELRVAVAGGIDAVAPPVLEAAPRIAGALWLSISGVNLLIWLFIGLIGGQWDPSWLLWVLFAGGVLVAGVWGARDWDRRMRRAARDTP
ncbi:hypothetical protein ORV05_09365 [Amycolatopsis cynarae]|uniref:DUF1707 domain-containing protein n=1 Tax=Amycolatopsis cynarae TaxID=2995223 RepID=A0ABY7BB95_9PSEU|nr:hypothetical protein [Amycolatopsis sp. HUAS 11-8]WAL67958.1 hypothetical protein ORV05_09365 [Amycolatopsis sp. HUAS 11-8]